MTSGCNCELSCGISCPAKEDSGFGCPYLLSPLAFAGTEATPMLLSHSLGRVPSRGTHQRGRARIQSSPRLTWPPATDRGCRYAHRRRRRSRAADDPAPSLRIGSLPGRGRTGESAPHRVRISERGEHPEQFVAQATVDKSSPVRSCGPCGDGRSRHAGRRTGRSGASRTATGCGEQGRFLPRTPTSPASVATDWDTVAEAGAGQRRRRHAARLVGRR